MKHGDISNYVEISVAFRCEDFLVKSKTNTLANKIINNVFGEFTVYEINKDVYKVMYHIYRKTDMTVDLVIEKDNYKGRLKKLIDDLPFNRIVLVQKLTEVKQRILVGDISYYVDNNEQRRNLINNKYAVTLEFIETLL